MSKIKKICKFAMGCALTLAVASCSETPKNLTSKNLVELDSFVTSVEGNGACMGAISVFEDGAELYERSWGYSNVATETPNVKETCYRLGSVSNLYTATIIMKLVEEGKLSLDSKLSEFFPAIAQAPKITIEDMLRHKSGIFNIFFDLNYWSYYRTSMSKEDLVAKIQSNGLVSAPGTKTQFSASNYILLSMVAEQVAGKEFGKLLEEMICEPLNLQHTFDGNYKAEIEDEANSYCERRPVWSLVDKTNLSTVYGESSVISTPTEVAKFVSSLMAGKIISSESLAKMTDCQDGYGIGFVRKSNDDNELSASGNVDGFFADVVCFKKDNHDMVSVCLLNGTTHPMLLSPHIVNLVSEKNANLPVLKQLTDLSSDEADAFVGVYTNKQYSITFEIVKNGVDKCLKLKTSYSSSPVYVECYKNGEFSAEIVAEELPVHFSVSADKHSLFLDNGMELVRES